MSLRAAVYIAPPVPFKNPGKGSGGGLWSPISCTLIYSATHAVLVDTPITIAQTKELIAWIRRIAPNRALSYIYITHGHGDHFFGIPLLVQEFPEAKPVATAGTVQHMKQQVEENVFRFQWDSRFPGEIQQPFVLAEPLPRDNKLTLNQWELQAVEVGHSDTYDSTVLWVPALRLAVCGDVVYGQVHQMLMETNTPAKRAEWIRAVEKVEALDPLHVVPGHCQEGEILGRWHLDNTKEYIRAFEDVLKGNPKSARDVVGAMTKRYPDRFNVGAIILGAQAAVQAAQSRI
ncbi:Beta-lactamase-like protein, partial [Metarhizium majus ARSEF 297]